MLSESNSILWAIRNTLLSMAVINCRYTKISRSRILSVVKGHFLVHFYINCARIVNWYSRFMENVEKQIHDIKIQIDSLALRIEKLAIFMEINIFRKSCD